MDSSRANRNEVNRALKSSLGGLKSGLAGGLGGAVDSIFTMPFDTVKTTMQLNKQAHPTMSGCVRSILHADGIAGFYRGYFPFAVMAFGKAGVRWGCNRMIKDSVTACGYNTNNLFWNFSCGAGAGVAEALVWTAPYERLKTLRQKAAGTGLQSTSYSQIFGVHGIRGLWVGASPTAMRSASNAAIRFGVAGHLQRLFRELSGTPEGQKLPALATFLAGGTGGAISTVCNNPVDVVKTRMQSGATSGLAATFKTLYKENGVRAFTAGLAPRVLQIFLSQGIQFTVVAQVDSYLNRLF